MQRRQTEPEVSAFRNLRKQPPMIITRLRPAVLRLPAALGRHGCVNCTKRFISSGPSPPPLPPPAPTLAVPATILASLTNELDKIAPRFEVDAERIHIIRGPADFYAELKVPRFMCVRIGWGTDAYHSHSNGYSRQRRGYSYLRYISERPKMSWLGHLSNRRSAPIDELDRYPAPSPSVSAQFEGINPFGRIARNSRDTKSLLCLSARPSSGRIR